MGNSKFPTHDLQDAYMNLWAYIRVYTGWLMKRFHHYMLSYYQFNLAKISNLS